jgi:hypothetical protein
MRIEEERRWILGLFVVALLLGTGFAVTGGARTAQAPLTATVPFNAPASTSTSGPLSYHAAIYANASSPTGTFLPGEQVDAQFQVQVPSYTSSLGAVQVRIPNSLAEFPSTTGPLHVYLSAVNFTITSAAVFQAVAGPAGRWTGDTSFNASGVAFLSTQGLSVMSSAPYGSIAVQFSWRWVMTAVDGTPNSGIWSPVASVEPPAIANLAGSPAGTWTVGEPYNLCMNGPIAGRTFGIHVSIANPIEQFTGASFTVPTNFGNAYCWNNTLPSNISTQQAFIHIWAFANVTFQLYNFPIMLVTTSTNSTSLTSSFLHLSYLPLLLFGLAVVIGVVVVVEVAVLSARRRRKQ